MLGFIKIVTVFSVICRPVLAASPFLEVTPGNAHDIPITEDNTLNATTAAPSSIRIARRQSTSGRLPLSLKNNLAGGNVNAYVTGLDSEGRIVMLRPNGKFYYPTATPDQTTPQQITAEVAIPLGKQGSTKRTAIPEYISSARIWFAEGELQFFTVWNPATNAPSLVEPSAANPADPSAGVNWGFIELTNTTSGIFANISYVDFVGLVLGIKLLDSDGGIQSAKGLRSNAAANICTSLAARAVKDGQLWNNLCMVNSDNTVMRAVAPNLHISTNPSAFEAYWTTHINRVWKQYTKSPLIVNTQSVAGNITCQVSSDVLNCEGDNRGYSKPTSADIFGCNSGPFAITGDDNHIHVAVVPRLCAAFHRG